ncbi:MAG: hypothetical protein EBY18_16250 [Alphaproteobacteria bacterium]|nr:hypothetical protein [Alphaproteobacteria bacterium]
MSAPAACAVVWSDTTKQSGVGPASIESVLEGLQESMTDEPMTAPSPYRLAIVRRGPPARPFAWEIVRQHDSAEVARSADTFRSRREAIADGERALGECSQGAHGAAGPTA